MIKNFMVVGTSNDVPNHQVRICGIGKETFKTGDVVYLVRNPITRSPIEVVVNNGIEISEDVERCYGCIVSNRTAYELGLDIGMDTICVMSKEEIDEYAATINDISVGSRTIELPIVFSIKCSPNECKRLLDEYIENGPATVRFYHEEIHDMNHNPFITHNPFGRIKSYRVTDIGYFLNIEYPKQYDILFDNYLHGKEELLCHPTVLINNGSKLMILKIGWISIFRQNELVPNMTYDGIHDEYRNVDEQ